MWKIGNVEINNKVVLAPMAGVSNSAFRKIIKEMGCGLIYAEMVSDKAISYRNQKTLKMLKMEEKERPIVQQIFGSDEEDFVKAAKIIYNEMHPDIIDINMGCPVPKIALKSQAGSALLKNPEKIYKIVSSVVKSVPIPVTVKIRSGWDSNSINAIEVAKVCEKAGAKAICVHGRTRKQGYKGKVDLEIIKKVKEAVNIPVIGNGDIKSPEDALKMLEITSCDAIMVGRGVLGNPYLIKQIINYIENKEKLPNLKPKDQIDLCIKHLNYLLEDKEEKIALLEMRGHGLNYIKGLQNNINVKKKLIQAKTKKEFIDILKDYKKEV